MRVIALIPTELDYGQISDMLLLKFNDLPMIVHVYRRACLSACVDDAWVVTSDPNVKQIIEQYHGKAILTKRQSNNKIADLQNATEKLQGDVIVLVNCNEILLNPLHIQTCVDTLINSNAHLSTLVSKCNKVNNPHDFKVVLNLKNDVMYMSRGEIPYTSNTSTRFHYKAHHISTFEKSFLSTFSSLPVSPLEKIEGHEQLRLLENGYKIRAEVIDTEFTNINASEEIDRVNCVLRDDPFFKVYR